MSPHFNNLKMRGTRLKLDRFGAGFTVVELMLAVAILGVIIYALFSVFNQTQRALRRSETNTDVAQKARAVSEMITTELEQAQPSRSFYISNNIFVKEINMLGGLERQYVPEDYVMASTSSNVLRRTNFIHNIFFYNNRTNAWQGIGYRVVYFTNGVGALQRFETNIFGHKPFGNLGASNFLTLSLTDYAYRHIADGVVHLTFIPYDHNGRRLGWDTDNHQIAGYDTNQYYVIRRRFNGPIETSRSDTTDTNLSTVTLQEAIPTLPNTPNLQYTTSFRFLSNALPAYVEMEFGMLEPETLAQYYTMLSDQNPNAASFLQRQIGKVHLFRQRIPIRTAAQ
jgi:prepilin-type N-terminal cleavage/methylation domain-containing protein